MSNRFLNNRIHKGALLLLGEYDFEIKYIKDKNNVVAAALNRKKILGTNWGYLC